MMHFKNHANGFSLIEVMIALTLFAVIMTTLLGLQSTLMLTATKASRKINGCILLKNFFYEISRNEEEAPQEKRVILVS